MILERLISLSSGWRLAVVLLVGLAPIARAELPSVQSWTNSRGARVLFVENHALPMLDLRIEFDAGARRDRPGKEGTSGFALGLLTLGAKGMDEASIGGAEADLGAEIAPFADVDGGGLVLRTLSDKDIRDKAVQLFTDILTRPDYPQAVLDREKDRQLAQLKQALTEPSAVAGDHFQALLYGDHPYGRTTAVEQGALPKLSRQDLFTFHRDHLVADRAIIALVGDISRADAERLVDKIVMALPASGPELSLLPPVVFSTPAANEYITFPSSQAHVSMGLPLIARNDPDFFALILGNYVLGGGGFNSRLTKVIRDQKGLAYSVGSSFQPLLQQGPFQIGLQTRKEEADNAVRLVREVVETFVKDGPTAVELRQAQSDLINGFALGLDSNRKWLGILGRMGRYRLPLDYLQSYQKTVKALTINQVRDAMRRHIDPKKLVTVVVGAPAEAKNRVSK